MATDTAGAAPAPRPRFNRGSLALLGLLLAVIVAMATLLALKLSAAPVDPLSAEQALPYQNLMTLAPITGSAPAPGFTLVDQAGRRRSLASFRGKAVVLEFMDPHCTDICPIVSHEFVTAYRRLGAAVAAKVAFVAVNVNQYHATIADMARFSRSEGLVTIPSWHFFTGPLPALRQVWADYGIYVHAPSPNADVQHSSEIFFIAPDGTERYLASPVVEHTKAGASYLPAGIQEKWAQGIAYYATKLVAS